MYIYVYIYIYIHTDVYMHLSLSLSLSLSTHIHIYIYIYIYRPGEGRTGRDPRLHRAVLHGGRHQPDHVTLEYHIKTAIQHTLCNNIL